MLVFRALRPPGSGDYDLGARRAIRPRGRSFELVVTPRYERRYLEQRYEALSADLAVNLLHGRELFVDVGAHCGFFTLLAATAHPDLEVIALEPVEESRELLSEGVRRNRVESRVEARLAAASDRAGVAPFHLAAASDNCGFYPRPAAADLGTTEVEAVTLDTLLAGRRGAGRAVVKIDVEGHELAVLAGLGDALRAAEDMRLLVELNPRMQQAAGHAPEDLVAELQRLGFETFLLDDWARRFVRLRRPADWRAGCREDAYANLYCVPRERALSVALFSHSSFLQGAERRLLGDVRMLVQDYGAVCTVLLPGEGPLQERLESLGAATLCAELPWWCDFSSMSDEVVRYRQERGLAALRLDVLPRLEQADPDVVETNTLAIPWGAVAAALLERPHVWAVSEYGELDHQLRFFSPFEEVLRSIAAASNLVLTLSEALRRTLFPELGPARCRTLDPWVEPPPEGCVAAGRASGGRARLGILASLVPGKDQATAIRALAELARRGHDAELVLAGHANAEYRTRLEALAAELGLAERVRMPGFHDDPYPLLASLDVLVMSAPHEAFGRTGIEAALAGVPVVLAASSGAAEVLADGRDALCFEPGDAADLAAKLAALLADPELARRLAASARRTVEGRLSRARVSALHHEILSGLRGQPNPWRRDPVQALVGQAAMSFHGELGRLASALAEARAAGAARGSAVPDQAEAAGGLGARSR
jgi:FkbM family methyltransferase